MFLIVVLQLCYEIGLFYNCQIARELTSSLEKYADKLLKVAERKKGAEKLIEAYQARETTSVQEDLPGNY